MAAALHILVEAWSAYLFTLFRFVNMVEKLFQRLNTYFVLK